MSDPNPFPANGVQPLYTTIGNQSRGDATYSSAAAEAAVDFFRTHMRHTQGRLAGQPFELAPEQAWVTREAFGWLRPDGSRLYRTVFVEEGRGNGKSDWGAGITGKLFFADGENDPELVGAAKDRKQAGIVMKRLKAKIRANPALMQKSRIFRNEIRRKKDEGTYTVASSDVGGAWGGAPHGIVFDEIHTQPNRELWDALTTGMGKRRQPQLWALTTAGWNRESLAYELHDLTVRIQKGETDAPTFIGVVWAAPEDADWTLPATWQLANPLLESGPGSGVTPSGAPAAITYEYLQDECNRALSLPAFANTFRTMYLSQWVGQETRFIPMEKWDACDEPVEPGHRLAFGGLDLASTTDLAAFVVVSEREGKLDFDVKLYAPADGVRERGRRDHVAYEVWAEKGLLTLTPGASIDQDYIKRDVLAAKAVYDLHDVSYDRWNASKLIKELEDEGVVMVQMGQGFASMSAPTKELLRRVVDQKVRHGGHPILRWMADNTAPAIDASENVKPDKSRSTGRIDGITATVMGIDGYMRRGQEQPKRESRWNDPEATALRLP